MIKRFTVYIISILISLIIHFLIIFKLLDHLYLTQFNIIFIGILAYIIYFSYYLFKQNVSKIEIDISLYLYLSVIFIALFLKGFSQNEIILNPLSFFDIEEVTIIQTVLNIMLMVPLGVYFKHYRFNLVYILIGFVLLECFQYLLNVGTFDLGDITLYIVGFVIGVSVYKAYKLV